MSAVVITLPAGLAHGTQISVVTRETTTEPDVLVRGDRSQSWVPISHLDSNAVEFRP